MIFKLKPLLD